MAMLVCGFLELLLHLVRHVYVAVLLSRAELCDRSRLWLRFAIFRNLSTSVHMFASVRVVLRRYASIAGRGRPLNSGVV